MSAAAPSVSGLDASALDWLDSLLQQTSPERLTTLERLAHESPALHVRLLRLLAASDHGEASSLALQRPMAAIGVGAAPLRQALDAGATLGGYRLVRELGRGGMSVVWLGERVDGLIKRPVALKMPLWMLESAVERERFARERDVLAGLSHAGIARLLDAGVDPSGQPFIVLEFVEGVPLTQACDDAQLGLHERVRLFLQVLEAVDHAHKHLVVHRDLKPSNILVDTEGRVRLLDFGIAKLLDDASSSSDRTPLTLAAGCALTPRYAAPEQLENGIISTATDVYALGVVLYELLCGVSPYGSAPSSMAQWMRAVLETEPKRPSGAARETPGDRRDDASGLEGDLENVMLKALRKSPLERYGSVDRLRDDLQSWLEHRPVLARRPTLAHRTRLFVRRNVAATLVGVLGGLAAITLTAVAGAQYLQSQEARQRADVVRDFMFDLVDDSERDEQQIHAEPTGREMVAAAVVRARARFASQPRLRGELLGELGRMQGKLGEEETSAAVLREAVGVLVASAPPGDAALNKARAYLADVHLGQGELDAASGLATAALAECSAGTGCAKARYYASNILGRVALQRGDVAAGLGHMRSGVAESRAGFGADNAETALALLAYAITARQAGQLGLAQTSLDQALAMSRHLKLRLSDRIALFRIGAVLSMDLGTYENALSRLRDALALAAKDSDRAELWRILATVHLAIGDAQAASDAADSAIRLAAPRGMQLLLARQAHARARSMLGAGSEATAEMAGVIEGLAGAGYAAGAMETMRARRFHAETQLRSGHVDVGLALLQDLARDQAAVQQGQEVEYAQTLDLLGTVLRLAGKPAEALDKHRQAAGLLDARLPEDHPHRLRNALYVRAAETGLRPATEAAEALARLATRYAMRFPEGSYWRRAVEEAFSPARCAPASEIPCPLFL